MISSYIWKTARILIILFLSSKTVWLGVLQEDYSSRHLVKNNPSSNFSLLAKTCRIKKIPDYFGSLWSSWSSGCVSYLRVWRPWVRILPAVDNHDSSVMIGLNTVDHSFIQMNIESLMIQWPSEPIYPFKSVGLNFIFSIDRSAKSCHQPWPW